MSEETLSNPEDYGAGNIQVLEGLEAVRKRPAMYIGDVGVKGLHHLIWEVVDNSIDEALAGHCDTIRVTVHEDNSITVEDNGRGIPTDMHHKEKKSALEVVLTVLHAGGKFDKDTYKVSGGLHGVGVSCVNALSSDLKATVYRNGVITEQEFKIGAPQYSAREVGKTDKRGTTIHFKPDDSIFAITEYKYETIANRLREMSFLNAGIRIHLQDLREMDEGVAKSDEFFSEGGLVEFVQYLDETREKNNRTSDLYRIPQSGGTGTGGDELQQFLHRKCSFIRQHHQYLRRWKPRDGLSKSANPHTEGLCGQVRSTG